jgi:hypothetical protein
MPRNKAGSYAPPQSPVLSPDQIRRRIEGVRRRISELEAFNPQSVPKRYNITEVVTLETSIKEALASAFGSGTDRYRLFEDAANLDQGSHVVRVAPVFGSGLGGPDYDAQEAVEARKYLAEGKERSIQLLHRAIRALEDDLADHTPGGSPASPAPAPASPSHKVFLVHGRDDAAKNEVALFLRAIGLEPIILHLRPNGGRHLLTKFREESEGPALQLS